MMVVFVRMVVAKCLCNVFGYVFGYAIATALNTSV